VLVYLRSVACETRTRISPCSIARRHHLADLIWTNVLGCRCPHLSRFRCRGKMQSWVAIRIASGVKSRLIDPSTKERRNHISQVVRQNCGSRRTRKRTQSRRNNLWDLKAQRDVRSHNLRCTPAAMSCVLPRRMNWLPLARSRYRHQATHQRRNHRNKLQDSKIVT
jgi:hypothetical protein